MTRARASRPLPSDASKAWQRHPATSRLMCWEASLMLHCQTAGTPAKRVQIGGEAGELQRTPTSRGLAFSAALACFKVDSSPVCRLTVPTTIVACHLPCGPASESSRWSGGYEVRTCMDV